MTGPTQLPAGRHPLTFPEVRTGWAVGNVHRDLLLTELESFVAIVKSVVPVCAVWIGGSFLTAKAAPGDIDVTLILKQTDLDALAGQPAARLLTRPGLEFAAQNASLRVDAFVLAWKSIEYPNPTLPGDREYLAWRGYWDDWWLRSRPGPGESMQHGTFPRRGYLEVVIDGYE